MDEKIKEYRAEVIEKFINLEWLIHAIISQHYFGKVYLQFILEVLYDEYCSFGLKRRILEKIVPDFDRTQLQNLNRLNTIRNYFAHIGKQIFKAPDLPGKELVSMVPHPREPGKTIDLTDLYQEFQKTEPTVAKYLFKVCENIGVKFADFCPVR